jgi:hypothetical protein
MKENKVTLYIYKNYIFVCYRTNKPLAIALRRAGRGLTGRDDGSNVNNVQYASNKNCHNESHPA